RRTRRGRANFHWLREQAVFALRFLDHRRAISRWYWADRRRDRSYRADEVELRTGHSDGRLHGEGCQQAAVRLSFPPAINSVKRSDFLTVDTRLIFCAGISICRATDRQQPTL